MISGQWSVVNFHPVIKYSSHREGTTVSPLSYHYDGLVFCGLCKFPLQLHWGQYVSRFQILIIQRPTTPILRLSMTYQDLRSTEESVTHKICERKFFQKIISRLFFLTDPVASSVAKSRQKFESLRGVAKTFSNR